MADFYVYILHCSDNTLYVGHTDDLEKRIAEHRAGCGAVFTSKRLPVKVIFSQAFPTREEAQVAEQKLKGWSRAKKIAFIEKDWVRVQQLAGRKGDF